MLLWLRQVHERAVASRSQVKPCSFDTVVNGGDADAVGVERAAATNAADGDPFARRRAAIETTTAA